jgi:nucleoside-diphosphate-sugar epimerase
MKLLLVGGTGVLSRAVVDLSLDFGYNVYVLNRGKRGVSPDVHLLQSDINDKTRVNSLINDLYFDVVVDFIGYTKTQVEGRINIFKGKCNQYIYISSTAVFATAGEKIINEESPLINQLWQYGVDKVACENTVITLCKENNIPYTIVRPGVTYDNTRIPFRLMPPYSYHWTIVERIKNKKPLIIWNDGQNAVTILRVEDFAVGLVGLFNNSKSFNEKFNITGDERYHWKEILDTLGEIVGTKVTYQDLPIEFVAKQIPNRKGEILVGGSDGYDLIYDNTKIKNVVPDFKTTIFLKEGLKKTVEHYKNNNYLNGIDYSFDADMDRIICNYHSNKPIVLKKSELKYIDYLNSKEFKNEVVYFVNRHKNNFFLKTISLALRVLQKLKRILRKSLLYIIPLYLRKRVI